MLNSQNTRNRLWAKKPWYHQAKYEYAAWIFMLVSVSVFTLWVLGEL